MVPKVVPAEPKPKAHSECLNSALSSVVPNVVPADPLAKALSVPCTVPEDAHAVAEQVVASDVMPDTEQEGQTTRRRVEENTYISKPTKPPQKKRTSLVVSNAGLATTPTTSFVSKQVKKAKKKPTGSPTPLKKFGKGLATKRSSSSSQGLRQAVLDSFLHPRSTGPLADQPTLGDDL